MKHEDTYWRLPKDWKPSRFDVTEQESLAETGSTYTRGTIWLPMGVVEIYTQGASKKWGWSAYSRLSMIKSGVLLERTWDRRYTVRYLVTLARRWQADRKIALGEAAGMLKRMKRPRLLVRSRVVSDRVTYQVCHAGSINLVHSDSRGAVLLTATELRALRRILNEGDPLAGLEVISYRLEPCDNPPFGQVQLQRVGDRWAIVRDEHCLNKDGIFEPGPPWPDRPAMARCRWRTAEAALACWQAREV